MTRTVLGGSAMPRGRRLGELAPMHQPGPDAAAIRRARTSDAARLLDRPGLGLLETGRHMDVAAIEGDPWAFDDLGARIRHIWKDGVEV